MNSLLGHNRPVEMQKSINRMTFYKHLLNTYEKISRGRGLCRLLLKYRTIEDG